MSQYLPILYECAWRASIIPLGDDPTFFAMKAFGGYNMPLAFVLAVIGGMAGQCFNWYLGRLLIRFPVKNEPPRWFPRAKYLFNRYGIFLLLFAWVPMLNALAIFAGFCGTKPKLALALLFIGEAAYYGYYAFLM